MEIVEKQPEVKVIDTLERLGFKTASTKLKTLSEKKRKLAIAYEFYRVVTEEKVADFQSKLRKKTANWDGRQGYHKLDFVPVESYENVPTPDVLAEMEVAQGRKCFDSYEVAYIKQVEDPLLFGRIKGCPDRFFIAQWDNDVSIDDILKPNEG